MKRNDFRILIAEDEPGARKLYEKAFRQEGYEVVMAESGLQMLAELAESSFDLVITDMQLPHMSGLEAIPHIRQKLPTIPIVVVSGHYVDMTNDFHMKGLHINYFFNKPLSLSLLTKTVRKILGIETATEEAEKNPLF